MPEDNAEESVTWTFGISSSIAEEDLDTSREGEEILNPGGLVVSEGTGVELNCNALFDTTTGGAEISIELGEMTSGGAEE